MPGTSSIRTEIQIRFCRTHDLMVRGKYDYAGLIFPMHEVLDTSLKLIPDTKSPGHYEITDSEPRKYKTVLKMSGASWIYSCCAW